MTGDDAGGRADSVAGGGSLVTICPGGGALLPPASPPATPGGGVTSPGGGVVGGLSGGAARCHMCGRRMRGGLGGASWGSGAPGVDDGGAGGGDGGGDGLNWPGGSREQAYSGCRVASAPTTLRRASS